MRRWDRGDERKTMVRLPVTAYVVSRPQWHSGRLRGMPYPDTVVEPGRMALTIVRQLFNSGPSRFPQLTLVDCAHSALVDEKTSVQEEAARQAVDTVLHPQP